MGNAAAEAVPDDAELRRVNLRRPDAARRPQTILTEGTLAYRLHVRHVMAWMYGATAGAHRLVARCRVWDGALARTGPHAALRWPRIVDDVGL